MIGALIFAACAVRLDGGLRLVENNGKPDGRGHRRRPRAPRRGIPSVALGEEVPDIVDPSRTSASPTYAAVLERLLEGILAFWDERVLDRANGGYRLGHDSRGRPTAADSKHLVTQARTAWFFARLARSPFGADRHLQWAAHGIRFLRERMWDEAHGGFAWEVGPAGPRDGRKHLYGQAFAIFALTEFGRAAGDGEAAALAVRLADTLYAHAHDDRYGGYLERRLADWSPEPPGAGALVERAGSVKTINTHLHLTEALFELLSLRPSERLRARLRELVELMSGPALDRVAGTCRDACERDWRPLSGGRSSYGHDLEIAWLLARAAPSAGVAEESLEPVLTMLWDSATAHGLDRAHGGFFLAGRPGHAADELDKVWWVQAEALLSALHMWRRTGAERYRHAFELTLGWIDAVQADRDGGDWHAVIDPRGVPSGDKSGPWKDPYHQGRAVLDCLALLSG